MLSLPFLKHTIKENYRIWLSVTGVMSVALILLMTVLYTGSAELLFSVEFLVFNEMIATGLYAGVFVVLSLIYVLVVSKRLVISQVETGTMAYYLATPNSRKRIMSTQSYFMILSLFCMFAWLALLGSVYSWIWGNTQLEIPTFILLNLGIFCLQTCISGICFLVSCICTDSKMYYILGAGLPILFYLISLLEYIGRTGILRFLTMFSLYNTEQIMSGSMHVCWELPILAISGVLLHRGGISMFRKRDLSL